MRFSLASLALDVPQQGYLYAPWWHHAWAIHGVGTFVVMAFYDVKIALIALIAALIDCLVHYHIDWAY